MARADLGDLGKIIERLHERGRLIRMRSEVDPVHDLAGVAYRLEGRGAAVLFEQVKGHDQPVFTGLYWSRTLLADLLELSPPETGRHDRSRFFLCTYEARSSVRAPSLIFHQ
jgi:2,5-furandicarboxylate decarboxylase 1